ncbi:hypothetical protein ACRRTK_023769 [Alexandromys fortis]
MCLPWPTSDSACMSGSRTHRDPPASASRVLGLKACATTTRQPAPAITPLFAMISSLSGQEV